MKNLAKIVTTSLLFFLYTNTTQAASIADNSYSYDDLYQAIQDKFQEDHTDYTTQDPTIPEEAKLIRSKLKKAKEDYSKESGYDAEMAGWMRGLEGASRGESLGQSLVENQRVVAQKKAAADKKYQSTKAKLDEEMMQLIIRMTISSYDGTCPCPFSKASDGSNCGGRSAYSKSGGEFPLCYKSDVKSLAESLAESE